MDVDPFDPAVVRSAYDRVADEYLAEFGGDLAKLPVDRAALDEFGRRLGGRGPTLDVGCGPGQVSRYLASQSEPEPESELESGSWPQSGSGSGSFVGIDLAPRMLAAAQRAGGTRAAFVAADMRSLPIADGHCAGLVAHYCVQHLPRSELGIVLGEFRRVLTGHGILALAAHLGTAAISIEQFLGHAIEPMGGTFYTEAELTDALSTAGFAVASTLRRDALPHEYPSERIYLLARAA